MIYGAGTITRDIHFRIICCRLVGADAARGLSHIFPVFDCNLHRNQDEDGFSRFIQPQFQKTWVKHE